MLKLKLFNLVAAGVLLSTSPVFPQTEVRQATPEDTGITEVPNPMLIEISLGSDTGPNGKERQPFSEAKPGVARAFTGMSKFRVDKAQVRSVLARREEKGGKTTLIVSAALATEYVRQDIDLTIALVSDGKEIKREFWDDLTIGTDKGFAAAVGAVWASGPKSPTARFEFKQAEWEDLWRNGAAPSLRLIIDIQ